MKKLLLVTSITLALTGCKVDFETEVNIDDLVTPGVKLMSGVVKFEVPACTDYEDSRKESRSLTELKQKVPNVFRNAQFTECYTQKMTSYAAFSIPVGVGKITNDTKEIVDTDLYILSQEKVIAGVMLTEQARERLKNAEKNAMGSFNFNVSVLLKKNKQEIPKAIVISSIYSNPKGDVFPMLNKKLSITKMDAKFTLSDVSVKLLMNDGFVPVLVEPEYFEYVNKW